MKIGIDVGGTNTDVVLIDGHAVLSSAKVPTTPDVTSGIREGLSSVIADADPRAIRSVVIGTTHFVNALTERRGLARTAALRLATPPQTLPPMVDWPADIGAVVGNDRYVVAGGTQFDGRRISPLDVDGLERVARELVAQGVGNIAISAVFSPLDCTHEVEAAAVIAAVDPTISITLSHEIGRLGLLGRENSAILNQCLRPLADQVVSAFESTLSHLDISAPLFLTGNDGTVMTLSRARDYPILSVRSGPINSMRGAAVLAQLHDVPQAVIVDVGGTTTDIGTLSNGFPRDSTVMVDLGGVASNFRMPDVESLGIGGGSIVDPATGEIGPASVGYRLTEEALVFGGATVTLTDIVVAAGFARIGDSAAVAGLPRPLVEGVLAKVRDQVTSAIDRAKTSSRRIPIVIVGGGAGLIGPLLADEQVLIPDRAEVANAVGSALSMAGGEIDRIASLRSASRESVIEQARADAIALAVQAGAQPSSVRVVDEEDIPLAHLPGGVSTRVRVRAIGDMQLIGESS